MKPCPTCKSKEPRIKLSISCNDAYHNLYFGQGGWGGVPDGREGGK